MSIKEEVREFLNNNQVAVVATAYRGLPFAAAMYYFLDNDFNFYFATKRNTDKYFNILAKQQAALVVGAGPKHISVQARGEVALVTGAPYKTMLKKLSRVIGKDKVHDWPVNKLKRMQSKLEVLNDPVIFKIKPQHLTFFNLDDRNFPASLGSDHHQILPKKKS